MSRSGGQTQGCSAICGGGGAALQCTQTETHTRARAPEAHTANPTGDEKHRRKNYTRMMGTAERGNTRYLFEWEMC